MENTLISVLYLNVLFSACERAGIAYHKIVDKRYLDNDLLSSSKNTINFLELLNIFQDIIKHVNEPLITIRLGSLVHLSDFGVVGQTAMNHSSIGEAITFASKIAKFINCYPLSSAYKEGESFIKRFNTGNADPEFARPYIEMNTSILLHLVKSLTNINSKHKIRFSEIRFRHSPAATSKEYEDLFQSPVYFNKEHNEVCMDNNIFNAPLFDPNIRLLETGLSILSDNIKFRYKDKPFSHQVELHIYKTYQNSYPSATETAKSIGVSLSTLKQRLAKENTNFKMINETIQQDIATSLITESKMTISEIAFLLGYSSSATFHRAFKRWTGCSPKVYRENCFSKHP